MLQPFTLHCRRCCHHADHAISLVFTNVQPDNPGRRFTITLDVEEEREQWSGERLCLVSPHPGPCGREESIDFYMGQLNAVLIVGRGLGLTSTVDYCSVLLVLLVVSLEPAVHGVRVLLNELNRTQNLTQFCKEIRKKFKESMNTTS